MNEDDVAATPQASGSRTWLKGDTAVWRGQAVEVEAHSGQLPVRLRGIGDIVMVWADELRTAAEGKERSDP